MEKGQIYTETFSFTQREVEQFAQISGDHNPLHLDQEYAAKTMFGKPIIHGVLGASIFSKILGMQFPGEGTIYLKQEMSFKRPMFVGIEYEAVLTVKEINKDRHSAVIETKITEKESGKTNLIGEAHIMNKEKI
ncbi:MAG: MaoC family dehydratase [Cytophagaceae bacterium]|nr:MaoC family dehydratase [Cytophagaceae bacterium]